MVEQRISDFDYPLPPGRIAQRPLTEREDSRLLVLDRKQQTIQDSRFECLPEYLQAGDAMVVNDCLVMPGRIAGKKPTGGRIEVTLLGRDSERQDLWECLVKASKKPKPGNRVLLGEDIRAEFIREVPLDISVGSELDDGRWIVRLDCDRDINEALADAGLPPLPPYIRRDELDDHERDRVRYQTVYAARGLAAAAPTAGLHFGPGMLETLDKKGIKRIAVTLEVGLGTFAPVRVEKITDHRMHPESFQVEDQAAQSINRARAEGHRCMAVGTTVVRTLEHLADKQGRISAGRGRTDMFIYPGYRFSAVDVLLTNFHLPRSTLLMLVCAFGGKEFILEAYRKALDLEYRFLSYGDAMLIL